MLFSMLAFVAIHFEVYSLSFSFTATGINYYLSLFSKYSGLYTGTLAAFGLLFGFMRLDTLINTYDSKVKEDKFNEWKLTVELRSKEMSDEIPFFYREILKIRRRVFDYLFEKNFVIEDKSTLNEFFNLFFKDYVRFFEQQNRKHMGIGGFYPTDKYTYSEDALRYTIMGMINDFYVNLEMDLKELYIMNMDESRFINSESFKVGLNNYMTNRRK